MVLSARSAGLAGLASVIDLGCDSPAFRGLADEFMAKDTAKAHIPPRDLKVGLADAGPADSDECLSRTNSRIRKVATEVDCVAVEKDASHREITL